jgi:transposase
MMICDNLKPHQAAAARRSVEEAGAVLMPLPPYSPDSAPIEGTWSKVRGFLRSAAARTTEAVYDAMVAALRAVCPGDILAWFKSCGLRETRE